MSIFQLLLDYSQRIGISICKTDLDLESSGLFPFMQSWAWCDMCTRCIPEGRSYYMYRLCSGVNVCVDCSEIGGRRLDHPDELVFKAASKLNISIQRMSASSASGIFNSDIHG